MRFENRARTGKACLAAFGLLAVATSTGVLATGSTADAATSPTPTTQDTLVIIGQFSGQTSAGITTDQAMQKVFTNSDSASAYFKEVSGGAVQLGGIKNPAGDVVGPVTLTDTSGCGNEVGPAEAAAKALGYDSGSYRHTVVFLGPGNTCNGGSGSVGGNWTVQSYWVNQQLIDHELGHNLGLAHAGSTTCKDPSGNPVTLTPGGQANTSGVPSSCSTNTYGDPYDDMGDIANRWWDAPQLSDIGWMAPSQVAGVVATGTYTLAPLESTTAATRAVRIPINAPLHGAAVWVENRVNSGTFDQFGTNSVTTGVSLVIASGGSEQHLLNMDPADSSFNNSALQVGQTFTYPGLFTVTLLSKDATTGVATVQVVLLPSWVTPKGALPGASVGTAYSTTISGSGGTPSFGWLVDGGALPPGMHIASSGARSATLSGTPTTAGTYNFKLRLRDAAGERLWRNFTVTVS